jgi:hypothetical protein
LISLLLFVACAAGPLQASLQFDVFLGYDGLVPEACWFPIVCEVKNDDPSFTAVVELSSANQDQTTRLTLELPTGTLKRFVLPVFAPARAYNYGGWDLRLLDERGKIRAEQLGVRPRRQLARATPLMGAISRTANGTPLIKPGLSADLQPATARLLPSIFPDNPLVLEGLGSLYLNSERAADLTLGQVNALRAWISGGGHLILGIEQPSDISSSPWLKTLCPVEVKDLQGVSHHNELQDWLRQANWSTNISYAGSAPTPYGQPRAVFRPSPAALNPFSNLAPDPAFESAEMQVAIGKVKEGVVIAAAGGTPLVVTTPRGRGRVTALLFSPEREPVRSWRNLPVFWAKIAEVPGLYYVEKDLNTQPGLSSDGIFGAMIDSRQVHKLPVGWLLLLLLVYLVVIGPFDQYWLRKIGRPMLTWITFPCYVAGFSFVIYFLGYKLRAGDSEWNELQVVDVMANGERADFRGRTYASVYSPANQRYQLQSPQKYAAMRGEMAGWGVSQTSEKISVQQSGDNFRADIFVPVWSSQMYVSDWWQQGPVPLRFSVRSQGEGWQVKIDNRTERKLSHIHLVLNDQLVQVGDLAANESRTTTVTRDQCLPLQSFVSSHGAEFREKVSSRGAALGSSARGQIDDKPNASIAVSFISLLGEQHNYGYNFMAPPGLDLSPLLERGQAVLLAWAEDYAPGKPLNQFSPRRSSRETLWRVSAPIE